MRRGWLAAAIAGAGAAAAAQLLHMRRVARDPNRADLEQLPRGRPVELRSADGTRLHGDVFGPAEGHGVVLVHGWTENTTIWIYVIRELTARGFRVICVDLRGHGKSDPAASDEYSLERFGEDVEAVLEACVTDSERVVLAGHSLGAMAIVAWAEHHDVPRRVGAVGLLNTGIGDLVAEHLVVPVPKFAKAINEAISTRLVLGSPAPLPRVSTPISHFLIRRFAFGPTATPAQIAFFERMVVACSPRVRADSGIAMSKMELHHALPQLTVPTMVMAGEKDGLTPPSHARRIAGALPQLHRLVVLPETGHMGPLERPHEFASALAELADAAANTAAVAA